MLVPMSRLLTKPGPRVAAEGVDLSQRYARFVQHGLDQRLHLGDVIARCHLRHHAPELAMDADLREATDCSNATVQRADGSGGFIAGGFKGKESSEMIMTNLE